MTQPVVWEPNRAKSVTLREGCVDIWRVDLRPDRRMIGQCGAVLTADEQERAGRFHFERDRRRYIVCRGALRHLLARYLPNQSAKSLRFTYSKWNKPFLVNDEIPFNVSHSDEWGLIAFGHEALLGVDIEKIKPMRDMAAIVKDVFSDEEQAAWERYGENRRPDAFFAGWTRKEAVVKAVGQGLSIPLKSFVVDLTPDVERPSTSLDGEWYTRSFRPLHGFAGAVVSARPIEQLAFHDFVL